jgi:nucleotide-binding universal stress UspA family protein
MKKMLVAIDGTQGAMKAVEYVAQQFSEVRDLEITLFHAMPKIPPDLWDDGHILSQEEKTAREKVIDKWKENQKLEREPIFQKAVDLLTRSGIDRQRIKTKTTTDFVDVAESILEEAQKGAYQTLVLGRCGHSRAAHFLMGTIPSKIISRGAGMPVCVVE